VNVEGEERDSRSYHIISYHGIMSILILPLSERKEERICGGGQKFVEKRKEEERAKTAKNKKMKERKKKR